MSRSYLPLGALAALIAFPLAAHALDQGFYIGLASRVLIYGLAVASLNFIVGFGGMISFGHAAFFGAGGYTVGILAQHAVASAWIAWPLAMLASGVLALLIGAVSLRTRGLYFIMITLAFAQMLYYFFVSLKTYGGDDGLTLARRSSLGLGFDLKDEVTFYYVVLVCFGATLFAAGRVIEARFGRVLVAIRENETRMEALGYPTYRYKLVAFVIAGSFAGLAGALSANLNTFVSPNALAWTQSGMLLVMVILGGVGKLYGAPLGAATLLILEEALSGFTQHWPLALGMLLLVVVLFAPQGIAGVFDRGGHRR